DVYKRQQTTLYDQIKYSGAAEDFAWVLPIKGTVDVSIGSDSLFAAIDALTTMSIVAPQPPVCPGPPSCPSSDLSLGGSSSGLSGGFAVAGGPASSPPPVTVLSQSTVGPYDQVQLQSTNPTALNDWLTAHGYVIPTAVQGILSAYVGEGFDFLAIRLSPGAGVQAMVPISVTTPGASLTLPLRMVAAGTGATVGITLWVIGDGRYEPSNFTPFTVSPGALTWDLLLRGPDPGPHNEDARGSVSGRPRDGPRAAGVERPGAAEQRVQRHQVHQPARVPDVRADRLQRHERVGLWLRIRAGQHAG
ncbi:MAG: DUF2330 domain-containing protein, partial [Polyangiaceae bacterium]